MQNSNTEQLTKQHNYCCWIRRNTKPLKSSGDALKNISQLFFKENNADEILFELSNSITYNYTVVISTRLIEPKNTSFCYMIEMIKENKVIETIYDAFSNKTEDKDLIKEYINIINSLFETHESDVTLVYGDTMEEIKEKTLLCRNQQT